MTGPFDIGFRLFFWRHWVGGYYQSTESINSDGWRRFIPSLAAALASCWVAPPFEIAYKAFIADGKLPENLRRNYKSSFDALIKIPFHEGPAFLYKNSLPTMLGTLFETFGLLYFSDYLLDWSQFLHLESGMPYAPLKALSLGFGVFAAGILSYPYKYTARRIIELYPKQHGSELYQKQYRKAFLDVHGNRLFSENYHGLANYYWTRGPRLFVMLWIAESLGLYRSWRTSYLTFPGINVFSDIHG